MAVARTVPDNTDQGSAAPRQGEMQQSFPFPRRANAQEDRTLGPYEGVTRSRGVLALVAVELDGFERAGSGVERLT